MVGLTNQNNYTWTHTINQPSMNHTQNARVRAYNSIVRPWYTLFFKAIKKCRKPSSKEVSYLFEVLSLKVHLNVAFTHLSLWRKLSSGFVFQHLAPNQQDLFLETQKQSLQVWCHFAYCENCLLPPVTELEAKLIVTYVKW